VTKLTTHKALKSITRGKLTFDERVVAHRVSRAVFNILASDFKTVLRSIESGRSRAGVFPRSILDSWQAF